MAKDGSNGGDAHDRQVDDSEFLDIAPDPAEARLLRKALQQLADGGAGEALQEMAREVLAGRTGLREAVTIPAYAEQLTAKARVFQEEWDQKTDEEREAWAAEGRQRIEQERAEMAEEQRAQQQRRPGQRPPRHDGRGWSPY